MRPDTETPTMKQQARASRERFFRWVRWAKANVPDQDAHLAASAAQMLDHLGHAVTADAVRARLRAQGRDLPKSNRGETT